MSLFTVFAIVITLTAIFSFINEVYVKLPSTIGIMLASLIASILFIVLGYIGFGHIQWAQDLVIAADFNHLFMNGMLSFLLFAAALRVEVTKLKEYAWTISYLATVGIVISSLFVGFVMYFLVNALGGDLPLIYTIIFGAIISPIDAVVVLKILKKVDADKTMETIITGESLFNDAASVVLFVLLLGIATGTTDFTVISIGEFFLREALGGLLLGLVLGFITHQMIMQIIIKGSDNHIVIILITLAIVSGGYSLAELLDVSAPLTSVVTGLFLAKSRNDRVRLGVRHEHGHYVREFWEVIDEVLNAVLFVLIGLEILIVNFKETYFIGASLVIPVIIIARYISVEFPLIFLRFFRPIPRIKGLIMTWIGIRGGVSIALALSLPEDSHKDIILVLTYMVVVFSILIQGLTLAPLVKWYKKREGMD
ncbi:MAG: sodium:proton antiporter [Thermodesulfobacteriota bacterium]